MIRTVPRGWELGFLGWWGLYDTPSWSSLFASWDCAPDDEIVWRTTWVFCGWLKNLEQEDVGPKGRSTFKQWILEKYSNLKFLEPEEGKIFSVHQDRTSFQIKRVPIVMNCFVWVYLYCAKNWMLILLFFPLFVEFFIFCVGTIDKFFVVYPFWFFLWVQLD